MPFPLNYKEMNVRILLIGQGLFLEGLTRILSELPNNDVIAAVGNWKDAREIVDRDHPNIIIVDHDKPDLRESDLAPLFVSEITSLQVIYLTLSTNKMVIHNRQRLSDVSVPDLIQALHLPGDQGTNRA